MIRFKKNRKKMPRRYSPEWYDIKAMHMKRKRI